MPDRIFTNYADAIATYIDMGYIITSNKRLISGNTEVIIRKIGTNLWRATEYECSDIDPIG